ncbi:MAG: GreA/GreB family elongation factor [Actinomycetota bacterium]|nr:GreA/GreB family elongation factor [Actinomycetota bacterium]
MSTARMTDAMRRLLTLRLEDLEARISRLDEQRQGDDSVDAAALVMQLAGERDQIADALRNALLIDDDPFDVDAIEVGDLVTIRSEAGEIESYVVVDEGVGGRARTGWVSVRSPLGAALLGRATGDRIGVLSPQGLRSYVIVGFQRASNSVFDDARSDSRARRLPADAFIG